MFRSRPDQIRPNAGASRPVGPGAKPWYALGVLTLVYTCAWVDRGILGVLIEPIRKDLHLADWHVGLLAGLAFSLLYSLVSFPVARLSESVSRVALMTGCLLAWSIMTTATAAATSFALLLLLRAGVGIGEAGCVPTAHSLLTDYFPRRRRAIALSVFAIAVPLGMFIGSLVGGFMAERHGWRLAFVAVGAPGVALAALLYFTVPEVKRGRYDPAPVEPGTNSALVAVARWIASDPVARQLIIGLVIFSAGAAGVSTFLATFFVRNHGLPYGQVGAITGFALSLPGLVGTLLGGVLVNWLARDDESWFPRAAGLGILGCGIAQTLAFLQSGWLAAAVLVGCGQLMSSVYMGATFTLVHNALEPRMRASATALFYFAMNMIGYSVGPLIAGAVSDFVGGSVGCGAAPAGTCAQALASGNRAAMIVSAVILGWGGTHYLLAARHFARRSRAASAPMIQE